MKRLLCWIGWHKPTLRMTPSEEHFFVDVPCGRCKKILFHKFLAARVMDVKRTASPDGTCVRFEMSTFVVPRA